MKEKNQSKAGLASIDKKIIAQLYKKQSSFSVLCVKAFNKKEINCKNMFGLTRLHYTAAINNVGLTKELIDNDAYLNMQGDFQETPLHTAAIYHSCEVAQALLYAGASRDIMDYQGFTAAQLALIRYERKKEEINRGVGHEKELAPHLAFLKIITPL